MALLNLLNASEIVAQLIAFFLALFLLRLILWKKFLKVLEDRRDRIATELKDIKDSKAALANIRADYEQKISGIEDTARLKIEEAVAEGKKRADELRLKSESEGEKILQNAKENIKDELARAKEDLKDSMVDLTIRVAQTVIQEKLDVGADRKLVEDFLKTMGKK
jgi:F-type H+-transporting ATPase subunit b